MIQKLRYIALIIFFCPCDAISQTRFNGDAKSCMSDQTTTLLELCPNGFGQPDWSGGMLNYIRLQPNIANLVVDSARRNGVDVNLALAVAGTESGLSACAGSFSGVRGPMQLTQATARGYGLDRDLLTGNIEGGMRTLRAAIGSCGGDANIRCLADRYNGSSETERRNWTNRTMRNLAELRNGAVVAPPGCELSCGPGDFPTTTPVASTPPPPAASDVIIKEGQI
jgi:soluble lytic murein transglycosylase-like protein